MSQISPPIRILLIGAVALMAAWFTVLKPKEEEPVVTPTTPTASSGQPGAPAAQSAPGKFAAQANQAATTATNAANAAAGATIDDTGAATTTTAPGTAPASKGAVTAKPTGKPGTAAAAPAEALPSLDGVKLPKAVMKSIDKQIMVMLFWNSKAADDRAVRRAVRRVYTHQGKAMVHIAPISQVSRYAPITRGVNVTQSPTVVVVDKKRGASAMVGYVDATTINQAVIDIILRDGSLVDRERFLQKLEGFCGDYNDKLEKYDSVGDLSEKAWSKYIADAKAATSRLRTRMDSAKTPKRWRGLKAQINKVMDVEAALIAALEAKDGFDSKAARAQRSKLREQVRLIDLRLAGYGMEDCR